MYDHEQTAEPAVARESAAIRDEDPAMASGAADDADCEHPPTDKHTRAIKADNLVKTHTMVAMSFGLVPLPVFDMALLVGNQLAMVSSLSTLYDIPFKESFAKSIVLSFIGGSLPVLGIVGLSSGLKLIPAIGSLVGSGGVALLGGALTYGMGKVFAAHFESGGTLIDLDVKKLRGLFNREVENGKRVVAQAEAKAADGGGQG